MTLPSAHKAGRSGPSRARLTLESLETRDVPSGLGGEHISQNPNDWPMFNHDIAGTRNNTAEHQLSPTTVGNLGVQWTFNTAGPIAGTPAVVNDHVYAADATGIVYALNRDGGLLWQTALNIGATFSNVKVTASVLVTNKTVIIGDQSGRVHGLNVETGAVKWTTEPNPHPFGAIYGSATMVDKYVAIGTSSNEWLVAPFLGAGYAPTFRGSLVLLDPSDGSIVWQTFTISDEEHAAGASGAPIWSTPTYDPATKTIYTTTGNNYSQPTTGTSDAFMALDAKTGAVKWVNQRTAGDEWTLVFGDSTPGHPDFDIGDSPQIYKIGGQKVISAGQKSGFFHVLDAATGQEINDPLQLAPPGTAGGLFADSAYADGVVYTNGSDWPGVFAGLPPNKGIVSAVSADGSHEIWRFETPFSPNLSGVAVANGVVYFQSTLNGTLFALDASTGVPLAQVVTGSSTSGPAISRGQIYLGTGDAAFTLIDPTAVLAPGSIICLGVPDPVKPPRITINDVTKREGNSGTTEFVFTVELSKPSTQEVTVKYFTEDESADVLGLPILGLQSDFVPTFGTLAFAPGQTSKTITVKVQGDHVNERNEKFAVRLFDATGATIKDDKGVGTILDDDGWFGW